MDHTTPVNKEKRFWLIVVIIVTLMGMGSCAVGVRSFFDEDRTPLKRVTAMKAEAPTRLEIDVSVVSTDPARGQMKVELIFHPKGDLLDSSRNVLAREVHLLTDAVGKSEIILKKGHRAQPVELTLTLTDGDIALYPIDRYNALLELDAYADRGGEDELLLPLAVNFVSHNHLLHVESALGADSIDSILNVEMRLSRPLVIQAFAWFMNLVMVLIGVSAAMVTYNVAYKGKKLEAGLMIWMGALLFVLPGIRGILPGVPPLGALTDYLVFFWVEVTTSICLFIMVVTWYRRAPADK
ncbi:MAG: hypothetical protein CFE44_03025 [Burkholderiales bacterium PBB4]|nr:MAG: hypothetical protein CFE44_03025 [Burkholderiales bacterium PBB4]